MNALRVALGIAAAPLALGMDAAAQTSQPRPDSTAYTTIFYHNGPLELEGYLYRPNGDGPFPVVIYNHGSRAGFERVERPFGFIGRLLTSAGYAVLVPERRGYGKSGGEIFADEIGTDRGERYVNRLRAESEDVLAALPFLATVGWVDTSRVAIMGWSFGGIVSVLAASQEPRFFAVVNQAGGALTWSHSPALQLALPEAARRIRSPLICMGAENDATTENIIRVCDAAKKAGVNATRIIYPAFTPSRGADGVAPGHAIFSAEGVSIWEKDVLGFLDRLSKQK
jgi:dienelactone hydrolase